MHHIVVTLNRTSFRTIIRRHIYFHMVSTSLTIPNYCWHIHAPKSYFEWVSCTSIHPKTNMWNVYLVKSWSAASHRDRKWAKLVYRTSEPMGVRIVDHISCGARGPPREPLTTFQDKIGVSKSWWDVFYVLPLLSSLYFQMHVRITNLECFFTKQTSLFYIRIYRQLRTPHKSGLYFVHKILSRGICTLQLRIDFHLMRFCRFSLTLLTGN